MTEANPHTKPKDQPEPQQISKESEWRLKFLRPIQPKPKEAWNQEHSHDLN